MKLSFETSYALPVLSDWYTWMGSGCNVQFHAETIDLGNVVVLVVVVVVIVLVVVVVIVVVEVAVVVVKVVVRVVVVVVVVIVERFLHIAATSPVIW
mmetsp:Transcript_60317/g.95816  ORF Transcript_60317/g.95816 Transcript_60317/m.95816 type:complete len:97 (-) Transcript_60317:376-666(-)